jgi:hypothetical protein
VARSGDTAAGTGADWTDFAHPMINDDGAILFRAAIQGPLGGLWYSAAPAVALQSIAVEATPVGSLISGATWSVVGQRYPWGADRWGYFRGRVAGSGITSDNDAGLFRIDSSATPVPLVTLIAREGEAAPEAQTSYSLIHDSNVQVCNGTGASAFVGRVAGDSVGTADARLFSVDAAGSVAVLAAEGAHAPSATGPSLADLARFGNRFVIGGINASGHVVFEATLTADDGQPIQANEGIWTDASGALRMVVRRGQAIPDCGASCSELFENVSEIAINDNGTVVFRASVTGSTNEGIWANLGSGGALSQIVREGDEAPGVSECAATFASGLSSTSARIVLAQSDDIVLQATLEGTCIDTTNDQGIWRYNPSSGQLELLLRDSGVYTIDGADRTLRTFGFLHWINGSGQQRVVANGDGRRSGYNNNRQLAISAVFTDNSQAVLVIGP